ncbi:YybH family protein [Ferrimonas balearica]|uniref:YybH family protein n=1 Tax=Ferrimonas balearica TaxID=44012 RepID=UPI001C99F0C0|nr:nuclear transport factor 2 family protein [Ferrimonas balearica]MBY5920273.1 nuclear transport factor 2 family protein [Ferrimonas balearica]MBY5997042.1 nuclear transport factor 2 family protein [Ferrimonas balearica]
MKSRIAVILTALMGLLIPVTGNAESVLEQLDAANKAFAKAIVAGDIDYLVNDYTDDACIIAPQAPLTCGKAAIRPFWVSVIESNPKNVELITQNAEQQGNLSYATGELIITDAESGVHKSRFVLVFKLVDGAWKLHVDSWTPQ